MLQQVLCAVTAGANMVEHKPIATDHIKGFYTYLETVSTWNDQILTKFRLWIPISVGLERALAVLPVRPPPLPPGPGLEDQEGWIRADWNILHPA